MARTLATDRYTEAQVLARIAAPGRIYRPRIEILDQNRNVTGIEGYKADAYADPRGSPEAFTILGATVTFDPARAVCGSLALEMLPLDVLADQPFRFLLRVWLGIGPMPDGGFAEYPMGVFVWMLPQRRVAAIGPNRRNVETWVVTCPDQSYYLAATGPRSEGFIVPDGTSLVTAVRNVYAQGGYSWDLSRIADSAVTATESLAWTWVTGATGQKAIPGKTYWVDPVFTGKFTGTPPQAIFLPGYWKTQKTRIVTINQEQQSTYWIDILAALHKRLGWTRPYFDLSGNPVGQPAPNPFTDLPAIRLETGPDTFVTGEAKIDPEADDWANYVIVVQRSTGADLPTSGVADLNVLNPNHPLAQNRIGFYKDKIIASSVTSSYDAAVDEAQKALVVAVEQTETLDVQTLIDPRHEAFDLVGFRIANDRAWDTEQTTSELSWSANLATGAFKPVLSRAFVTFASTVS